MLLLKPYTFRIWVHSWLVMLSHAVLRVIQVFPSFVILSLACIFVSVVVFHPSRCEVAVWGSMLWFEQQLEWWRWLIPSWHVVLESAKDRILGVDTPGQHVPPRVWCGVACLLIRNTVGCVVCLTQRSGNWHCDSPSPHGARGACGGNLSTASGACGGNHSKAWHTPVVDLCNDI
jgi:hypothetical protein